MKQAIIRASAVSGREDLHRILAEQLDFPAYYGKNLDALYDMLTEGREPVTLVLEDPAALAETLEDYYPRLELVLEHAAAENPALTLNRREAPEQAVQEAIAGLYALQRQLSAYDHALALLFYDGATTAPRGTGENRAETAAVLSQAKYLLTTGSDTVALLELLDRNRNSLTEMENRMVELLLKDIRQMQKIPMEEFVALQRLLTRADDLWHTAKEQSDFSLFEPVLTEVFAAYRRVAGYCAPEMDPYDYWLDQFEEGLDRETCDRFFATLRAHIVPLLKRVQSRPQLNNQMLRGDFPEEDQAKLSALLMERMGLDTAHVALGTTEHPFTTSLGSHLDERISTHYYPEDFSWSMFSVIHEGGHALYDTGSADCLVRTVLDGGVSMGIHESQSRFYENLLARSKGFCRWLMPVLREIFPGKLENYTAEDLYQAVNRAEPSLIRTEADELTYCLHVMIRYELEKQLFDGTLQVCRLPEAWNRLYAEYLGVEVPDDKHGVLQDSHWAGGNIGYFPSYALGSAYGAQLLEKMKETVDVEGCLSRGDFGPINDWNRRNIWRYGCRLKPGELFRRAAGGDFDPKYYTDYLEKKYTELYDL